MKSNSKKGLSKRNAFYPADHHTSYWKVLDLMVDHKIHRVPIIRGDGEIVDIISQRKIIQFISTHSEKFPILLRTIEDVHLGIKEVYSITPKSPILEAFKIISAKRISAVAVLDEKGSLVGEINSYDMKVTFKTLQIILFQKFIEKFQKKKSPFLIQKILLKNYQSLLKNTYSSKAIVAIKLFLLNVT